MILYYTTVFPAVLKLAAVEGVQGVLVFEDTYILTQGVDYSMVRSEVRRCSAGVFGYGLYEKHGS